MFSTPRARATRLVAAALALAGSAAALVAMAPVAAAAPQAGTVTAVASAAQDTRAMWVWDTSTPAATVDLAVSAGIDQLFVAVPPNLTTSSQLPNIKALSDRARAAGIRVDALGGDPGWVYNPTWVVTYWLKPAKSSGLFTGIHVDVEPYSTSAWGTDQATVVSKYLTLLDKLKANAGTYPIEADIPFWFNTVHAVASTGAASTLDREIMKRTAGVTVMSYRNTAAGTDGTLDVATPALAAGAALGKPVRLGQETNYLGATAVDTKQTFYGWTRTAMEAQLAQVNSGASASATYAGLVIHDATGYAAMAP
ncbi:hypothetical protein ASH01_21380 [Terrabacter sp. Soil811]|uniref:hypothetical protein n=1 Tax=Terrabacter sp. Soil811 TaxID=1736419 RepID=UPI0006FDC497|nr:hypothetical protein [Terrabacter sp. Soil811]KRF47754.1 hypothetical protein ASH01_21380 [Terrabacter sp. Soil811]